MQRERVSAPSVTRKSELGRQGGVTRPIMLFDNITPTNIIEVVPGSSIQAAVNAATPGTRINVYGPRPSDWKRPLFGNTDVSASGWEGTV